jgi:hypothetical protein
MGKGVKGPGGLDTENELASGSGRTLIGGSTYGDLGLFGAPGRIALGLGHGRKAQEACTYYGAIHKKNYTLQRKRSH